MRGLSSPCNAEGQSSSVFLTQLVSKTLFWVPLSPWETTAAHAKQQKLLSASLKGEENICDYWMHILFHQRSRAARLMKGVTVHRGNTSADWDGSL